MLQTWLLTPPSNYLHSYMYAVLLQVQENVYSRKNELQSLHTYLRESVFYRFGDVR